ncbi:MAG TPA: ABC transporter permease [Terracidiphilus sp.]|nr:ABC transporter permease [Terracidiphilus sp.]
METLLQDLRFALRTLARSPGFTATAILTLALGIGANTAVFSVVDGVVLKPLPYPEPDRLVLLWESRPHTPQLDISIPDFLDWESANRSFAGMAAMDWRSYDLTGPGAAAHVDGMQVTSGFFKTLGIRMVVGRDFMAADDQEHAAPTVIISDRLWRDRFAASSQTAGKALLLDGTAYTVVGVLPPGFRFYTDADVYTPLAHEAPRPYSDRTIHGFIGIGRLNPGVTVPEARSELGVIQDHLDQLYAAQDRNLGVRLEPLKKQLVGDAQSTLLLLFGAVGVVLLIACANMANLLLARSAARAQEFAVRSALGAKRSRLIRQLLTESAVLALAGGVVGTGIARLCYSSIVAKLPVGLPFEGTGLNLPILGFVLAASLLVGILFGFAPALSAAKVDSQDALRAGRRGATRSDFRAQGVLVVVQVALTLVLLAGSGLLLRTIRNLWNINPGFDPHHVIAFKVGIAPRLIASHGAPAALEEAVERIRQVPGIEAADFTNIVPLNGDDNGGPFWLGTTPPASPQDAPHALYFWTGPDYLKTMGIPLLQGRFFTAADTLKSEPVIVIDSALARAYFPGMSPIGRTITVAHWGPARVIGVVGHVRHYGLDDSRPYNPSQIYISLFQLNNVLLSNLADYMILIVRTPIPPGMVMPQVKQAIDSLSPDQPVYKVQTAEEVVTQSMSARRFPMMLLAAFAALALSLACVGIYGVLAYSVARRVREIGIRMALGAEKRAILCLIIGQGLRMVALGLFIGIAVALALTRFVSSFSHLLYGVGTADPATFVAVSGLLVAVAIGACWIPARRAMGVEPTSALRAE